MRRLIATLACRNNGSRLYGKPLQHLDVENRVTILDHLVDLLKTLPVIDEIVLGVSEGSDNLPFLDYARDKGIGFIIGDARDVLQRLIQCAQHGNGTDAFRVTTECPFIYFEKVEEAWKRHVEKGNDVTSIDMLPHGCHFELYTLEALQRSHRRGKDIHRSELCSRYVKEHMAEFQVDILPVPKYLERYRDLRLTVDNPEDLIVCRQVYSRLKSYAPRIPLDKIIDFMDSRPDLKELVTPYHVSKKVWPV